ncbi:MAG: polymer-forming cytoskeletal protein [Deltaproteobacteria bacterium]|nr:polymer-forming cytoskeletal protein [Deltaproteobacteria bacterium]
MALMRREEAQNSGGANPAGQTHTILGPESSFDGKLSFTGAVRIDGKFKGEITTSDVLVVGEGAEVEAQAYVGSLVLNGTLRGNVFAKKSVELMTPAKLYGNVETPSLVIHNGVIFEGSSRMENLDKKRPEVLTKEDDKKDK